MHFKRLYTYNDLEFITDWVQRIVHEHTLFGVEKRSRMPVGSKVYERKTLTQCRSMSECYGYLCMNVVWKKGNIALNEKSKVSTHTHTPRIPKYNVCS